MVPNVQHVNCLVNTVNPLYNYTVCSKVSLMLVRKKF